MSFRVPDAIVVNASPLVFLGNAGRLDLLRVVGASRIIVPEAVYEEVALGGHQDAAASSFSSSPWIERVAAVEIPDSVTEWDLGPGESAVIATALTIPGANVVIDDLAGRRCALASGLGVLGTLGVVIRAYRAGRIDDPRAVLLELRARGMWLSDAVIQRTLQLAGLVT